MTVDEIRAITDPIKRVQAAIADKEAGAAEARSLVAEMIAAATAEGVSQSELARQLDLSRQRISQLANPEP